MLFNAIDDLPLERIIWMPAHQAARAIGSKVKSGGTYLTAKDVKWNDVADKLAKRVVEDHRVPHMVRKVWQTCLDEVKPRAM